MYLPALLLGISMTLNPVYLSIYKNIDQDIADKIVKDIREARSQGRQVVLNIQSSGGYVYQALRIMDELDSPFTDSVCIVDKYAASAATFILESCKHKVVSNTARLLYHLPYIPDTKYGVVRDADYSYAIWNLLNTNYCFARIFTHKQEEKFLMGLDVLVYGFEYNIQFDYNDCHKE